MSREAGSARLGRSQASGGKKTLLIVVIFIVCAGLIAYALSTFVVPQEKTRYQDCVLLQNSKTGTVDCFGCYNNICKDASSDWKLYKAPEIGIPYACFKNDLGCQLAQ